MSRRASSAASLDDGRRRGLLDAAVTVFARYGYRKASMEEVARAAQVSRQGLYLHFATKEALFRAAVTNLLAGSLQAATAVLRDGASPLEERLVRAFDEWVGRYVGMFGAAASDLVEAADTLIGPVVAEHEGRFAEAVTRAITAGRLAAAYRRAGLGARQLADTLLATARGLKHGSETREEFGRAMAVAVRVMCAPLAEAR